jgi:pimeloyl-ACP methyl ester carboxylesterase
MTEFKTEELSVNGKKVTYLTAGQGEPLLFFHGAGIFSGFDFALPWTEDFRVIIPHHPGWGDSEDDPTMTDLQDYVMHYLDFMDALGLEQVNLVGFSLGGWLAGKFAMQHPQRVKKLVLVAPAGIRDKQNPMRDVLAIPPEQVPALLASNFEKAVKPHLPTAPDMEFMAARYREGTTVSRLIWERPWDPALPRYLRRATMPTLIVWGDEDRLIPVQQAETWRKCLPNAEVQVFKGAGHLVLDEDSAAVQAVADFLGEAEDEGARVAV